MKMLLGCLVLLAGCSTMIAPGIQNTELEKFAREDLNMAIAIAQNGGDEVAANCYTQVRDYYAPECVPPPGATECAPAATFDVKGAFSAHALARQTARQASVGMPEHIKVACAPLIVDLETFTLRRMMLFR